MASSLSALALASHVCLLLALGSRFPSLAQAVELFPAHAGAAKTEDGLSTPPPPLPVRAPGIPRLDDAPRGADSDVRLEWAKTFEYQGGPIIHWPLKVVNIFYGDWSAPEDKCAPHVLGDLVKSISSPVKNKRGVPSVRDWWKTVGKYKGLDFKKKTVFATSTLKHTQTWFLPADPSSGSTLTQEQIEGLVVDAAKQAAGVTSFSNDTVYNLFLAEGVKMEGFESCAFHAPGSTPGLFYCLYVHPRTSSIGGCGSLAGPWTVKYNGKTSLQGPFDYTTGRVYSSNGCLAADTLADTVIHELSEHVTDPLFTANPAWLCTSTDNGGQANCENADICTLLFISNPANKGPPNKINSWPAVSTEAISFKGAVLGPRSSAWYNLAGINGRRFYTAPQLDSITKLCTMSG